MDDWRSIFRGTRESAELLAGELEKAGLRSFIDSRPGPYVTKSGTRAMTIGVLVPPQEFDAAQEVARQWRSHQAQSVSTLSQRIARIFGLSLLPPALWYLTSALFQVHHPSLAHLLITWIVSLVVLARVEHRRHRNERVELPAD